MATAVELRGVEKRFRGRVAVQGLDLDIESGGICGFIGPNGSGKTTSLRIILRILQPEVGTVRIFGKEGASAVDDRTGYLPEERGLYRRMKVHQVLRFFARLKNLRQPEHAIEYWLTRLGLADRAHMRIEMLSKGLAQKVQFAAAVIHAPKLLVLDEPFAGLDPVNLEVLREIILELAANTTILLSTHDMNIAEQLCDRVVMLHEGHKVLDGPVSRIRAEHAAKTLHEIFVAIAGKNRIERTASASHAERTTATRN